MKDNYPVNLKLIILSLILPVLLTGCATQMVTDRHGTLHETKWGEVINYEKNSSGDYIICAFGNLAQRGPGYYQIKISKRDIPIFKSYDNCKLIYPNVDQFTKLISPPVNTEKSSAPTLQPPFVGESRSENCITLLGWDDGTDIVIYCPSPMTYDTDGKILLPLAVVSDIVTFPVQCILVGFSFLEQ